MRFVFCLLLTLTLCAGWTVRSQAGPSIVFDARTGDVLKATEAGKHWYPASLTKLMTAYLTFGAIDRGELTLTTKIKASKLARAQPPSKIGIPAGASISVGKALQALIVRSANDIAVVLAEGVSGSVEQFVRDMNMAAKRLGMTGTYFANPHGLPDQRQMTTARDMGLLARAIILKYPQYQKLFQMRHVQIGKRKLRNRNGLLKRMTGADGMKTGFICASGYNLVASATRNGRKLVAVLLGERSGGIRTKKAQALLEEAFAGEPQDDYATTHSFGPLANVSNARWNSTPANLQRVVCKRSASVRLTRPSRITGWGVVFGEFKSATKAQAELHKNLMSLRHVVYAGYGAIVKNYETGGLAALIGDLEPSQVGKVCNMLRARNAPCVKIEPGTLKDPPKPKKKVKKKRRRSPKNTKRRSRKAPKSANFSEAKRPRRKARR